MVRPRRSWLPRVINLSARHARQARESQRLVPREFRPHVPSGVRSRFASRRALAGPKEPAAVSFRQPHRHVLSRFTQASSCSVSRTSSCPCSGRRRAARGRSGRATGRSASAGRRSSTVTLPRYGYFARSQSSQSACLHHRPRKPPRAARRRSPCPGAGKTSATAGCPVARDRRRTSFPPWKHRFPGRRSGGIARPPEAVKRVHFLLRDELGQPVGKRFRSAGRHGTLPPGPQVEHAHVLIAHVGDATCYRARISDRGSCPTRWAVRRPRRWRGPARKAAPKAPAGRTRHPWKC